MYLTGDNYEDNITNVIIGNGNYIIIFNRYNKPLGIELDEFKKRFFKEGIGYIISLKPLPGFPRSREYSPRKTISEINFKNSIQITKINYQTGSKVITKEGKKIIKNLKIPKKQIKTWFLEDL